MAAAYVAIFAESPIAQIQNRAIGLTEFLATGSDIAKALERKHGAPPQVYRQSLEQVDKEIQSRITKGDMTALVFVYRRPWGEGKQVELVGNDVWDVKGYEKATLEELVVEGKLEPYKEFPPPFAAAIEATIF